MPAETSPPPNMALDSQGCDDNMAVCLRDASKSYDKGKTQVLDSLNMFVPRGCIYGLLGSSGCGKTTILSVIVGLLKLDKGEVKVLGGTPGQKDSGVPGPRIGFMPQESALVDEFTVKDSIYYFGWLYGMKNDVLKPRFEFLSNLLNLPPSDRLVQSLSGGQLRRLSFAVAMVQSPELLILDEPTVGQDPVLRHKMWNYMSKLAIEDNVTIVITTHYIAEAKDAHRVGLLRNGTLLAETSPNNLLIKFNCETLEDVSLILSQRQTNRAEQESTDNNQIELAPMSSTSSEEVLQEEFLGKPYKLGPSESLRSSSISRMRPLLYKNFIKLFRNIPGLFFIFLFPIILSGSFFFCIGGDPFQLPIGIVNEELGNCYNLPGGFRNHSGIDLLGEDVCRYRGLSCIYLDLIDSNKVDIVYYESLEKGLNAINKGRTYSTLYFPKNFTESMQIRQDEGFGAGETLLNSSEVTVWMDMTDFVIANGLKKHYLDKYKLLLEHISDQCNYPKQVIAIPIRINDPVYGESDASFLSFVGPGFILSLMSFMTTTFSATVILMEKIEGVWDRNLVAGVLTAEIMSSHMCVQLFVMIIQMVEIVAAAYFLFTPLIIGNVWIALGLIFIQGLCGTAFGLLIGSISSSVTMAYTTSMGSFLPYIMLSGTIWPLEGMTYAMRIVSQCLPATWATEAIRNVLFRGWGITHARVYPGFLVPIAWVIMFTVIGSLGVNKARK